MQHYSDAIWASWHDKSLATWPFVQQLVESNILLALCEGNPPVTGGFHSQRANNVESKMPSWWPYCLQQDDKSTAMTRQLRHQHLTSEVEGILPRGPYPPCLRMADRARLAGYPRSEAWGIYWENLEAWNPIFLTQMPSPRNNEAEWPWGYTMNVDKLFWYIWANEGNKWHCTVLWSATSIH